MVNSRMILEVTIIDTVTKLPVEKTAKLHFMMWVDGTQFDEILVKSILKGKVRPTLLPGQEYTYVVRSYTNDVQARPNVRFGA